MFRSCWLFVAVVTVADIAFAAAYRDSFEEWELNPFARAVGFGAAVAIRVGATVAACALTTYAPPRTRATGTAVVVLAHVYLVGAYAVGFARCEDW